MALILISGYCATGKSTFARNLSKSLSLPCFIKDNLKETMADAFGSESTEIRQKGSAATFNEMLHIAECLLKVGKVCILESNFRQSEGERICALLKKYDADCLTYIFSGDLDLLYDRYVSRENAGERHWVHLSAGARDDFKNSHTQYKIGQLEIGTVVNVDSTDFAKVNYSELISTAKIFLQNSQ